MSDLNAKALGLLDGSVTFNDFVDTALDSGELDMDLIVRGVPSVVVDFATIAVIAGISPDNGVGDYMVSKVKEREATLF